MVPGAITHNLKNQHTRTLYWSNTKELFYFDTKYDKKIFFLLHPSLAIPFVTAERCQVFPDLREERHRRLEFSTSAVNILNSLEYLGYRVVTSGSFVASQANNKKVQLVVVVVVVPTVN